MWTGMKDRNTEKSQSHGSGKPVSDKHLAMCTMQWWTVLTSYACSRFMVWHSPPVSCRAPGFRRWLGLFWHFYTFHLRLGLNVQVKKRSNKPGSYKQSCSDLKRHFFLYYLYGRLFIFFFVLVGVNMMLLWSLCFGGRLGRLRGQRRHRRQWPLVVQVLIQVPASTQTPPHVHWRSHT